MKSDDNNKPLISIIIPCYNDDLYVEQAVNSAINQTYPNTEIIIVDDGSNLETKKILNRLKDKVDKIITQKNQGVCVARNNGIKKSKGNFILVLDSDDFFEAKFLEISLKAINKNNAIGLVTCFANVIDEKGTHLYLSKPTGAGVDEVLYNNNAMGSCLFSREVWEKVGGYDLNMKNGYEDWEFNVSVAKLGYKVEVIKEVLFNYRYKKVSRNKEANKYQKEIRKYVFTKHKDLGIRNYDKTIDFFLKEIEVNKNEVLRYKNSKSFKIGHNIIRNLNKVITLFKK